MRNKLLTPETATNKPRDTRLSAYKVAKMLQTNRVESNRIREILIGLLIASLFLGSCVWMGGVTDGLTSVDCARGGCK